MMGFPVLLPQYDIIPACLLDVVEGAAGWDLMGVMFPPAVVTAYSRALAVIHSDDGATRPFTWRV